MSETLWVSSGGPPTHPLHSAPPLSPQSQSSPATSYSHMVHLELFRRVKSKRGLVTQEPASHSPSPTSRVPVLGLPVHDPSQQDG